MVAWLSSEGWTAEELSFVEEHPEVTLVNPYGQYENIHEKVKRLMKIHDRQETQKGEREREYDSKNNYQGKDSPEWFRASIDRNLFK